MIRHSPVFSKDKQQHKLSLTRVAGIVPGRVENFDGPSDIERVETRMEGEEHLDRRRRSIAGFGNRTHLDGSRLVHLGEWING